jgi:tetratricopeptide (TPR) repeat protein
MSAEKKWLVKSNDHILGPFVFDQVVENIFKGETHLLDEIKGPFERWRPIKDHSLFAAAIEKLKATSYNKRENTVTGTFDIGTKTHEFTKSETSTNTSSYNNESFLNEEVDEDQLLDESRYGSVYNNNSMGGKRTSSFFVMSFIFFILLIGGYLFFEFNQSKLVEQKETAFNELTDKGLLYLKTGDYNKALKNFSKASNINPVDPHLTIEMAPLSVQFDGRFSQVEIQLSNILANNINKDYIIRGKNVIGLTQSYRSNFSAALKFYDEVLTTDPSFLPSLLNKAYALLKLNRSNDAIELMGKVVKDYPEEPLAHYLYIKSLVENAIVTKDKSKLKEALSIINHFTQKFSDLKQEVLFLSALASLNLDDNIQNFYKQINNTLKVDFELTNLHVHDPQFDLQSFNWLDSLDHCQTMIAKLDEFSGKMLEGFCFLKMNRVIDAKKIFEVLLAQNGNDGILQALYASTLLKLEEFSQAKNALGFVEQVNEKQPIVETLLRGCLISNDQACVETLFKSKHAKHISLLYSHWGNSFINLDKNPQISQKSVQLGLGISPNFSPLLKIKYKLKD